MRAYVYKKDVAPMVVDVGEIESYKVDGWEDSPIPFILTTDFGVDPEDKVKVQCLGESIQGVTNYMNDSLNLALMKLARLKVFAEENISQNLKKFRTKKTLLPEIQRLIGV